MKCIDFDAHFNRYVQNWIAANAKKYRNADEMEQEAPELYLKWSNQAADWLEGASPATFFTQFDDADMLSKWMLKYVRSKITVPGQLLDRLADIGEAAVKPLLDLVEDRDLPDEARMNALGVLQQIQPASAVERFVNLIVHARNDESDLANLAAEILTSIGPDAKEPVVAALGTAKDKQGLILLDTASNFPRDDRIYDYAIALLRRMPDDVALIAGYLGKLGDERAIDILKPYLQLSELNYLDYLSIKEAIEELGGEVTETREFAGDEYYESMKNLPDSQQNN